MKFEWKLCFGTGMFLGVVAVIYWFWSKEPTGTACLVFGAFAWLTISGYLWSQGRKLGGVRPEDDDDATMEASAGPVDFFPAASIWPAGMGLGLVLFTMSLIFGWWWAVFGLTLVVGGVIGFATEAESKRVGEEELPVHDITPGSPEKHH